jgi:hypothetical protein
MRPDDAHLVLLRAVPQLGALFGFDEVLGNFGQFAWDEHVAGRTEVVARAFEYVEWLQHQDNREAAERAVRAMFKGVAWPRTVVAAAGPATLSALARADWFDAALLTGD